MNFVAEYKGKAATEKNALALLQRLHDNREEDEIADFIIESKDGVQTKVHSQILLSRY